LSGKEFSGLARMGDHTKVQKMSVQATKDVR
jgi:hypothetical protein